LKVEQGSQITDLDVTRISIVSNPAIKNGFFKRKEMEGEMEKQKLTPEVIDAIKRVLRMLGRLIGYPEAPAKKFMDEDIEKVLAPEEIRALRQAIRILQDALGKYGYYIRPYYYGYRYPLIRPRPYAFYGYGYRYKIPGYYYRYPRLRKAIEAIMYDIDELMKIHDDDLLNELQESFLQNVL